jgi:hypothetical protein
LDWAAIHSKWIEAGGDPDRFWCLTPGEMDREAKAMVARLRRDREFEAWGFWTIAQLTRVDPKHFPKLADFLRIVRGEKKREQTIDEMIATAKRWQSVTRQL